MGDTEETIWDFVDAWLLTAIGGFGRQGCSLSKMIGAADALNHDIPTEGQASSSLGRLTASHLVEIEDSRYRLTVLGRSIYKQRGRDWFDRSKVLRALEAAPRSDGTVTFAPGEFEAAYNEYR